MRKLFFLFSLLLLVMQATAQQKSQVQLTSSQSVRLLGTTTAARFIRPVFTHEGSTLSADSADYNQAANAFDAYGNVVITQPSGTVIYGDKLNYNGNTRIAILTNNVRLLDKDATLTTNHLTYNMASRTGTYYGGGKLINAGNELTSKNGYYFASTRDAYFRHDVLVKTPDSDIKTDSLQYNTESKIAWFFGPTNIRGKGANSKSNLYTENGRYNTLTDEAWFGKKNLYTEGTKSLKGDSLYYNGKSGYGKAINNITFLDTEQKVILKGNQGIYRRSDESAMVTRNAYITIEARQDSAKTDSIWMTADTLLTKRIRLKDLKPANPQELVSDEDISSSDPIIEGGEGIIIQSATRQSAKDSVKADTEVSKTPSAKKKRGLFASRKKKNEPAPQQPAGTAVTAAVPAPLSPDSLKRPTPDTSSRIRAIIPAAKGKGNAKTDSLDKGKAFDPRDTMQTRVVYAYHNVKIFKSDLQSRSDSAFYSYADSIIRCYKNPVIWTQGSQLTGDTVFLQLKNQKLDNMLLQGNGFIVNTEADSSRYNQVKGKVITGLFKDSKLVSMSVDGNAESIYYTLENNKYTGFNRAISSRMRMEIDDSKVNKVTLIRKSEGKYYPIEKVPKDLEILEGFIWKPKERPRSKEEIIPSRTPAKKSK